MTADYLSKLMTPEFLQIVDPVFAKVDSTLSPDFGREIKGLAQRSGVDLRMLAAMNLLYDLTAYCTSIVGMFCIVFS